MKRIWETYRSKIILGILLTTLSAQADLIVMHHITVARHDEQTGAVLSNERPPVGIESTDSGVFGPDGNIYVVGNTLGDGSIHRFNGQTGVFADTFVDEHNTALVIPMGMAFGPDGDLYVCSFNYFGNGGGVFHFDGKTGAEKAMFIPFGDDGVTNAYVIRFSGDGDAYVLDSTGIIRFKGDTGARLGMIVPGRASDFQFGPDGRLYVLNTDVKRYDATTGTDLGVFATAPSGQLDTPVKFAFGPDGDLFVGEYRTLKIKRFDGQTGAYKGIFAESPLAPYNSDSLTGLAFSPHRLSISSSGSGAQLKWPNTFGHFKLEKRNTLDASGSWSAVEENPTQAGSDLTLTLPAGAGQTYFRLTKQN
jgi:hypothetical protein